MLPAAQGGVQLCKIWLYEHTFSNFSIAQIEHQTAQSRKMHSRRVTVAQSVTIIEPQQLLPQYCGNEEMGQ